MIFITIFQNVQKKISSIFKYQLKYFPLPTFFCYTQNFLFYFIVHVLISCHMVNIFHIFTITIKVCFKKIFLNYDYDLMHTRILFFNFDLTWAMLTKYWSDRTETQHLFKINFILLSLKCAVHVPLLDFLYLFIYL